MSVNSPTIPFETKNIPVPEFPDYIREQALENRNRVYCIIDIANDEKLCPFLKHGDWEYYWLNKTGNQFADEKVNTDISSPCLITLDPGKITVRKFTSDRLGKNLITIIESSASRQDVINHCLELQQTEDTNETSNDCKYYDPAVLRESLSSCSDEDKQHFFKCIDTIWVENDDDTVLELNKKTMIDETYTEKHTPPQKRPEKRVVVLGDHVLEITRGKDTVPDIAGEEGFGVMGDF